MKILITGIGNIGKSTLREKIADKFPGKVLQIDMDYYDHVDIPQSASKAILVEDVHGLDRNPEQYDKIIYLLPPSNHIILWLRRAWAWYSSGKVDLSDPKGVIKPYALSNLPIILKIVMKNILCHKKWVKEDIDIIKNDFKDKTIIVKNMNKGYDEIVKLIVLNR
jgi:hypothetical protein